MQLKTSYLKDHKIKINFKDSNKNDNLLRNIKTTNAQILNCNIDLNSLNLKYQNIIKRPITSIFYFQIPI